MEKHKRPIQAQCYNVQLVLMGNMTFNDLGLESK